MDEKKDFDRIFRKYYNELYCFAMQFMHDPDDARDIVHDAYEDVWRHFADMEEHSVRGYLYKNVRNKAIDLLRRIETRRNYRKSSSGAMLTANIIKRWLSGSASASAW